MKLLRVAAAAVNQSPLDWNATWRRFPILSGSFRRELAELDAAVSSGK